MIDRLLPLSGARRHRSTNKSHRLFARLSASMVAALLLLSASHANAQAEDDTAIERKDVTADDVAAALSDLEEPMYTPFIELYLLEESKALRKEMQNTRAELIEKVVDKELSVADKTMAYATDTVTYFFYLIAGATSVLVVFGWNSIRDMRNQLTSLAEKRVNELVVEYESRLKSIEEQLQQKSDIIHQNQAEIERTNEVHSLWLKASQETSQQNKIAAYDQILDLRPDDVEALSYKADAVLEMREPLWAISLCQRALKLAPDNGHAHYQLACAYAEIGRWEDAITTLQKAIDISEAYRDDASVDVSFEHLREHESFRALVFVDQDEQDADA
ncbi:TPR end-of-group domain-containing protein [Marinobacter salinexigens]|uniref:TPR end-of-group domain-containing protein n=1 Tax=Marinobacter salinexigens TaxID=2919747 RepID=UPI003F67ACB8